MNEFQRDWLAYLEHPPSGPSIHEMLPLLQRYLEFYLPAFRLITRLFPKGSKIIEVGIGSAFFCLWLAQSGYNVTGIDIDERIIALALDNAKRLKVPTDRFQLHHCDAFQLDKNFPAKQFDLGYSRGLLEHFPYENATELIRKQAFVARHVFNFVPGKNMKVPRTDERFYDLAKLKEVHRKAGLEIIRTINYGDEPYWLSMLVPPQLRHVLEKFLELGSEIGVLAE